MNAKYFVIILSLFIALFVAPIAAAAYVPHVGDHFSYYEVTDLGSGTGDYTGYTEHATYNGAETISGINNDGTVSAHYSYSYTWSNSTGTTETGSPSGDFTFSPTTFLYTNGTDDQTGYDNPTVWFVMDNLIPVGGTFTLLNTEMTVESTNYSYYLPSQNMNVNVIFAQGQSSYDRNDVYGQFTATYTWNTYSDPTTGYIVGYSYNEQDTNPSGTGFTYTETLYVTSTSYQLTAATTSNPTGGTPTPAISNFTGPTSLNQTVYLGVAGLALIIIVVIVIILILIYAFSRRSRKTLPKHSYQQSYQQAPPPPSPPPENFDLTPKQPAVQQIVVKEVVKVKCRYCGALIDSTAETCPICGAPRT
jgi:hypothetical protein